MNRSAVAHIPASQYAFARSEDTFTIRLRAAKGDLDLCTPFLWGQGLSGFTGKLCVHPHAAALQRLSC